MRTEKQKKGQSFAKFVDENQGYYTRSRFGDVALIDALKHAMHWRLRTEVGRERIQPLNWEQWIRFVIEQEAQLLSERAIQYSTRAQGALNVLFVPRP